MHILWLPSWFPTSAHPLNGIFFKEQLKALVSHGLNIRLIYPDLRRLREFNGFNLIENHFQKTFYSEDSLEMLFFHGWNLYPKQIKKQKEQELRDRFENEIKALYTTDGPVLVKLIHRETGKTTYDLLKESKRDFAASEID
mgnify:CR=1 FL=1